MMGADVLSDDLRQSDSLPHQRRCHQDIDHPFLLSSVSNSLYISKDIICYANTRRSVVHYHHIPSDLPLHAYILRLDAQLG